MSNRPLNSQGLGVRLKFSGKSQVLKPRPLNSQGLGIRLKFSANLKVLKPRLPQASQLSRFGRETQVFGQNLKFSSQDFHFSLLISPLKALYM